MTKAAAETVKLQVRLPRALHERLVEQAVQDERSLNGEIVVALRDWIASETQETSRGD